MSAREHRNRPLIQPSPKKEKEFSRLWLASASRRYQIESCKRAERGTIPSPAQVEEGKGEGGEAHVFRISSLAPRESTRPTD